MKKKLIAGVFLATMVASLAGCSTSKETKTTTSTESTKSSEVSTVKEEESTTQVVKDLNYYIYTATDEELLSQKQEVVDSALVAKYLIESDAFGNKLPEYFISGIRIKSMANAGRIDVGRDYTYDVYVCPTSIDGHDITGVMNYESEKVNSYVNDNENYEYGSINAQVVVLPSPIERLSTDAFTYLSKDLTDSRKGINFSIKRIVLSDSIKRIDGLAYFPNLTKINLPASLESIGDYVFEGSPTVTATVDKGSYAETYCKEHNIKFEYREDKGESTSRLLEDSLPAWKTAYIEYFNQSDNCNFYSFNLVDINLDGIPEICTDYQQGGQGLVYINKNNEVKEIYDAGYCSYGDKDIKTQRSAMEYISTNIYRFDEKSHDYINVFLGDCSIDINGNKKYKIGNIECSEEEYNSKVESNTSSNSYADIDTAKYKKDTLIKKITDYK